MSNEWNNRNNPNPNNPYNNNPNVNMYYPPDSHQNVPVNQPNQQGYGYGANSNQQNYSYPVPQVNPEEEHHDDRANFVLPESAKIIMIVCAILCFLIFLIILIIK